MENTLLLDWRSIDALPLFSATIKVMLEETEQQYHYILYLKKGIYRVEKELIIRMITFYQMQLGKVMYCDELLQRWLNDASRKTTKKLFDISELIKMIATIKKLSYSVINLAKETEIVEGSDIDTMLTVNKQIFLDFIDGKFEEKNNAKL